MARVNSTNKETASNFSPDNGTGAQVRGAIKDVLESLRPFITFFSFIFFTLLVPVLTL